MSMRCWLAFFVLTFQAIAHDSLGGDPPKLGDALADAQVVAFARLALQGMASEYPNKPSNVMVGPESVKSPRGMHPAFYGCFDWHSSVLGHWMLIRLRKRHPDCSIAEQIRAQLGQHLTAENIRAETAHFDERLNQSFERMYGCAWTLRLAAELHTGVGLSDD